MKLVSYIYDGHDHLAALIDGLLYDTENLHPDIPNTAGMLLQYWEDAFPMAYGGELMVKEGKISTGNGNNPELAELIAPVPFPASFRMAEGISSARPVYSFANHHSVRGQGDVSCLPVYLDKLGFSPQLGIVIGKHGRNVKTEDAEAYIAGFTLMNKFWSGTFQHFATATGPWLVTLDELAAFEIASPEGHKGKAWDFRIRARINGEEVDVLQTSALAWTFAELIEEISYGIDLYPGDIVGCGPLSTKEIWLKDGDEVELEAEGLGMLTNTVVAEQEMG